MEKMTVGGGNTHSTSTMNKEALGRRRERVASMRGVDMMRELKVKLKEEEEERQGGGWVVQGGVRDEDSVEVIHELV